LLVELFETLYLLHYIALHRYQGAFPGTVRSSFWYTDAAEQFFFFFNNKLQVRPYPMNPHFRKSVAVRTVPKVRQLSLHKEQHVD